MFTVLWDKVIISKQTDCSAGNGDANSFKNNTFVVNQVWEAK